MQQPRLRLAAHTLQDQRIFLGVIRFQLGRNVWIQLLHKLEAVQLAFPVQAHGPAHGLGNSQGVHGLPRLWPDAQQVQLRRQPARMGRNAGIDAFGIPFQDLARLRIQRGQLGLGGAPKADDAAETVGVQRSCAEDFGQAPRCTAPALFQLPHAILGMKKTLGAEEVGLTLGIDMGHAMFVPSHLHRFQQARCTKAAVELGVGALHEPPIDIEPDGCPNQEEDKQDQQEEGNCRATHI